MIKATTIIAIKKDGKVAMAGDGQVTFGDVVFNSGKPHPIWSSEMSTSRRTLRTRYSQESRRA